MKRYILLALLYLCYMHQALAQVATSTLVVSSNPTAVLSDWANDNSVLTYVVTNQENIPDPLVIKTVLMLADGTVIATKDLAKAQRYILQHGVHVYYAADVMPLETMVFTGSYRSMLEKTGKLRAGNYQISAQMVKAGSYEPVTKEVSKFFNLTSFQLPVLIKPLQGDTLGFIESQTAITFRWSPVVPMYKPYPNYRLQVFEVLDGQQAVQAMRSNQPLLDMILAAQTQYIWHPQLSFIDAEVAKRFIWTIQTLDGQNNPLVQTDGNGESRSEPIEFFVRSH